MTGNTFKPDLTVTLNMLL